MKKRPTSADIAEAAQVSLMTVSRVMNNKPGVSEEVRQRIWAIAEEMGYRPNQLARGLATRQTSTIGLVVPDITNPFFAQIVRGAEDMAFEQGYSLFLVNTSENIDREAAAFDSLWQKEIDGVIICSPRLPMDELEEHIARFPAVLLFNREVHSRPPHVATLTINDQLGAELALRHFVAQGRKRIGFVAGPTTSISSQHRLDGYRAGLQAANLLFDPLLLEHCAPTMEGGRAATHTILARRPRLEAIFAFNDLVAVGVMQACQEAGRQVPQDIAVIGVDDIPLAALVRPQLTTLGVDLIAVGRLATEAVLTLIRGDEAAAPLVYQIDPQLIVRESA